VTQVAGHRISDTGSDTGELDIGHWTWTQGTKKAQRQKLKQKTRTVKDF